MNIKETEEFEAFQPRHIEVVHTLKPTGQRIIISSLMPAMGAGHIQLEIGSEHAVIEKPRHHKTSYKKDGEVWFLYQGEIFRVFAEEYHFLEPNKSKQAPLHLTEKIDLEKAVQEKIMVGIDNDFEFADGWVDCDGNFHAIGSMQHEATLCEIRERLNREELAWFFQNWVKISLSMWSGLHIFSSEMYSRTQMNKTTSVTARQKLCIERYLEKRSGCLLEGKDMDFFGYGGMTGKIRRENGKIVFVKGKRYGDID